MSHPPRIDPPSRPHRTGVRSVLLAVVLAGTAAAADWPQWRGPERDGRCSETGLATTWPAGGPPLAWKAGGIGGGYASVAVVKDRVYTTGDLAEGSCVICLKLADGGKVWQAKLGRGGGHQKYPGTRSTPTVDGGQVFALAQLGEIVCLDAATGAERWRVDMQQELGGSRGGWNYAESLLVDGDQVLCTPGGRGGLVAALDRATGKVRWRTTAVTEGAQYVSLMPATIGGVAQYVQMTMQAVYGIARDGRVLWTAPRAGKTAVIPTPIVKGDLVFVTSGYGVGGNCFAVAAAGGAFNAKQVYAAPQLVNHHGGVVLVGDHLYGHSDAGGLTCLELSTGKMAWQEGRIGKGAVLYAQGHLWCRNEGAKGTITVVEANPARCVEKGAFDQPQRSSERAWPHPVIAHGRLFLRDQDVLLAFDVTAK